jgi:WD40 repeat protein
VRLVSGTRRAAWIVAGTVWLAGCAAVWWALPVGPRAEWTLPPNGKFLDVIPAIGAVAIASLGPGDEPRPVTGPLQLREIDTGRSRSFLSEDYQIERMAHSPDGRWIALVDSTRKDRLLLLLDTVTGDVNAVAVTSVSVGILTSGPVQFSPDGRLLAVADRTEQDDCIRLFDLPSKRLWMTIAPAMDTFVFSGDSRWLAYVDLDQYHVLDLSDGSVRHSFRLPPVFATPISFTTDASCIITFQLLSATGISSGRCYCWEVDGGRERWSVDGVQSRVLAGGHLLPVFEIDDMGPRFAIAFLNTSDGSERNRFWLDNSCAYPDFAPDGKSLMTEGIVGPTNNFLLSWLRANVVDRVCRPVEQPLTLLDSASGRVIGQVPRGVTESFSSDGRLLAVVDDQNRIRIWDVPPRKPLAWYTGCCALLVVPLAWLARRRVRRLRLSVA